MHPKIVKATSINPYLTPERCYVAENHGDPTVSVAQAIVKPGVTTKTHHLKSIQEIYLITQGTGRVFIGNIEPSEVGVGDLVVIPPYTSQRISNIGNTDLVFYCICTPRFIEENYVDLEPDPS